MSYYFNVHHIKDTSQRIKRLLTIKVLRFDGTNIALANK